MSGARTTITEPNGRPPPRTSSSDAIPDERYATEGEFALDRVPGGNCRALLAGPADSFRLKLLISGRDDLCDWYCASEQKFSPAVMGKTQKKTGKGRIDKYYKLAK
jgi:hypothetical protein